MAPDMADNTRTGFPPVTQFQETRRKLPHWQGPGETYFVTFTAKHGSVPAEARKVIFDACLYWNGKRCRVHSCVVMPDHVHLLLTPLEIPEGGAYHSLSALLHSIKSYSAKQVNQLLKTSGSFWIEESHDHIIRCEKDFVEKWNFIRGNPVARGIAREPEEYPFLFEEQGDFTPEGGTRSA